MARDTENQNDIKTLYVSDLDGTLLDDNSQLSAGTVATLNRIIGEQGGLFTVATARTPATVVPLLQQVHATLPFIVIGGSAMWNPVTGGYEHTRGIDDATVKAVAEIFDRHGLYPFIYRRHGSLLHTHHYGPMSAQEERFVAERQHLPLKKFFLDDGDYYHSDDEALLIFSMNKYAILKALTTDLKAVTSCTVMLYHDIFDESEGYLEIFTAGTSKAGAIRLLAREVGARRIVVFGDNRNDIAMMQAADHSVAVGNAFPEVKATASEVIGVNTADSVARWIEQDLACQ